MKIFTGKNTSHYQMTRSIVTIGKFDGVHLGHQKLISRVVRESRRLEGQSVVIVVEPADGRENEKSRSNQKITPYDKQVNLIANLGVDVLIKIQLDRHFLKKSPDEFISRFLADQLGVIKIIVGPDFHFGRNRSGDIHTLLQYGERFGFEVEMIPFVRSGDDRISSTAIRTMIGNHDFEGAARMLGRGWVMAG